MRCTFWGAIFLNKEASLSYNLSRRSENEVENQVHILRHFFIFFLIKKPPWVITYPDGVKMRLKMWLQFWGCPFLTHKGVKIRLQFWVHPFLTHQGVKMRLQFWGCLFFTHHGVKMRLQFWIHPVLTHQRVKMRL